MRYFCTYFDRNYLLKGLALIESLTQHAGNFKIFVICMDEFTRTILNKLKIAQVVTVPMHDIEQGDTALLTAKGNRSVVEYLWTSTSTIIFRLLERHPEIDILTYLDADLYFFSSPEPIFTELGKGSVLIHEHRFPPQLKHYEKHGKYNVGLLCFRNDLAGRKIVQRWREQCIEWCYNRIEDGKLGDQGYLNDWPSRYPEVVVTQNIGVGVAPWNQEQYRFSVNSEGKTFINEVPIVFYHYHAFTIVNPALIVPVPDVRYKLSFDILRTVMIPYIRSLSGAVRTARMAFPDFMFGLTKEDFSLEAQHTFLVSRDLIEEIKKFNPPQTPYELNPDWVCYCGPGLTPPVSAASV